MEKKITFYVYISNKDLSPASLFAKAIDCGSGVPDSTNVTKLVPPQRMEEFKLETQPGSIELTDKFKCTLVAGSSLYDVVAKREVLVKPLRRCICNRHCLCVCMGESMTCEPMEEEDFHAAGFRGSLPILTAKPPYRPWFIAHPFLAMFAFILLLLLIGLSKGLFGLMRRKNISYYGLERLIYRKKKIKRYHEPHLRNMDVVYNDDGYPIDPDTGKPACVFSEEIIFAMNAFFCCIWPYMKLSDCFAAAYKKRKKQTDTMSEDDDDDEEALWKHGEKNGTGAGEDNGRGFLGDNMHSKNSRLDNKHPPPLQPPKRPGQEEDQDAPNAIKRKGIRSGKSLRNVISASDLPSHLDESHPDPTVKTKAQQQWERDVIKANMINKQLE